MSEMSIKLGTKCVVEGCENTINSDLELTFHRFPTHRPELSQKWMNIVNRECFIPSRAMIVCSDHFPENSFQMRTGKRILKANAIPTLPPKQRNNIITETLDSSEINLYVDNSQLEEEEMNVAENMPTALVNYDDQSLANQPITEPTVFLIHSYAHMNNETENLNTTLEGFELSNIDFQEFLKNDKEKIIPLQIQSSDPETQESELPCNKKLKMSIAYIRF